MKLSNKAYDIWKIVAWIWAPLITLITALVNIWLFDCKYFEQIIATLVAIDTFIGGFVSLSNSKYNKELAKEEESK